MSATRLRSTTSTAVTNVTASTTGVFEDTTNSDYVTPNDAIGTRLVVGTGGNFTMKVIHILASVQTGTPGAGLPQGQTGQKFMHSVFGR